MENKMNYEKNLKILNLILSLILILYFKSKIIIIFLSYKFIHSFINIIIKSINKINYEQTLKGYIYSKIIIKFIKFINFLKKFIYYYSIINVSLLSLYNELIPKRLHKISGFSYNMGFKCLITSLLILIISVLIEIN